MSLFLLLQWWRLCSWRNTCSLCVRWFLFFIANIFGSLLHFSSLEHICLTASTIRSLETFTSIFIYVISLHRVFKLESPNIWRLTNHLYIWGLLDVSRLFRIVSRRLIFNANIVGGGGYGEGRTGNDSDIVCISAFFHTTFTSFTIAASC